jgi:hypothetical protein
MTIIFSPSGSLDVAKDPSELPEVADQNNFMSGAMVRCKNLRLNEQGKAKTRDGSAKLNATAIASITWIEVQATVRYSFAGTAIYADEASIATGLANAQWAAIQYNAFNDTTQQVFALNGTDRKRIQGSTVYEWGIAAPSAGPTVRSGAGAGLTGEYNARYTYVRKVSSTVVAESDPSPAATTSAVLVNSSLAITPTQPTDPQVTHIRFYRTTANGVTYSFAGEVAINSTYDYGYAHNFEESDEYESGTGYKFTIADSTHGSNNTHTWEERYRDLQDNADEPTYTNPFDTFDSNLTDGNLGDLVETDHDRPPTGEFVFGPAYDGTCFIIDGNLLHYCKPKQPEYWPATYFIEVGPVQFPLQTGVFHNGQPFVFSKIEMFYVQGTGHGTFFPLPMKAKTGAQSTRGACSVAGKGIYHTGPDGIYLFASGSDSKITEDALEPLFRGESVQGMPGVQSMSTAWVHVFRNHLYFGYQSSGYAYPTNVLVLNLETNRLAYYTYNDGSVIEIRAIATDERNARLLIGDTAGFVRVIENTAYEDDGDEPVAWEVQSKDYTLQTRKHFPRWCKYDVDASNATTCTGALILGGAVHHSHTITGNRDTRRRLVGTGNGNRAAIRISGTGPVAIYAAESE